MCIFGMFVEDQLTVKSGSLFQGFLVCSIGLNVCFYGSPMLCWLL